MPFEEKMTWVNLVVAVVVPVAYFAIMLGRLGDDVRGRDLLPVAAAHRHRRVDRPDDRRRDR